MRQFSYIAVFILWLSLSIVLLFAAYHLRNPALLFLRLQLLPTILSVAILGACLSRPLRPSAANRIGIVIYISAALVGLITESSFLLHKNGVFSANNIEARQIGQHFIIGYRSKHELKPLIQKGLIGGIFLTSKNIRGKSKEMIRKEIAWFQTLRHEAGLPPLIVAADQEGGIVSRLSPPLKKLPPLSTLASLPPDIRIEQARNYGAIQGQEMAELGFTLNFSPVVDLQENMPEDKLDFYSHIGKRSIASDPDMVSEIALAYIQGLKSKGIDATLKHFPGMGRTAGDTHLFSAYLNLSSEEMLEREWKPFQHITQRSPAYIMIGHVILNTIDPDNPASTSQKVVQEIIRKKLGFSGLLITDDLSMGAAYERGMCNSTIKALNAGVDLLLITYDTDQYYEAMHCALSAQHEDMLDSKAMSLSEARLNKEF